MIGVLDIGGTSIKYGVLASSDSSCQFLFHGEKDSDAKVIQGPGIVKKAADIIRELMQRYAIQGIAVSTAGMVDAGTGTVLYANENIPQYTGTRLKEIMVREFGLPCWVENDVNAAALGEYYYGSGRGCSSMLMLTVGTGIGGAVVLQGDIYRGYSNSAGEVGYMWLDGQHFQDMASTTALVRRTEERLNETGLNGRIIFERAQQGDIRYQEEIAVLSDYLAKGISNCVCLLNPQLVVLGGGIMVQRKYLEPLIKDRMRKYMNPEMFRHTELAFARLGNKAGMAGAYACYQKKEGYL